MAHVFTVGELTRAIKQVLEGEFPFVWVRGQVSNLSRPGSGHVYFSLKDDDAVLGVVWFKGSQSLGRVRTGEDGRPMLMDGQEVLCAGRLNVYPPRGSYQLVAEMVQDLGVGRLYVRFEELKKKLAGLGYFDASRKRALPSRPRRVGVITAPGSAALRDFLRLADERGAGAQIRVYPSLVQGEGAAEDIAHAVEFADAEGFAEVLVLIRGGGSLEDLWAFNTEVVARAVYESGLPVVVGVGHEVDMTIADMVADVRAATPSHAAQILWPERRVLAQELDELEVALVRALKARLAGWEDFLAGLHRTLNLLSPRRRLDRAEERLDALRARLPRAWSGYVREKERALDFAVRSLNAAYGPAVMDGLMGGLESLALRLAGAGDRRVTREEQRLAVVSARLEGLNPEGPLERGYSLVRVERTGRFLREPGEVSPGDRLDIRIRRGRVAAEVVEDKPGERD